MDTDADRKIKLMLLDLVQAAAYQDAFSVDIVTGFILGMRFACLHPKYTATFLPKVLESVDAQLGASAAKTRGETNARWEAVIAKEVT